MLHPRQDSNLRTWLRRPLLYPLSYEGWSITHVVWASGQRSASAAISRSTVDADAECQVACGDAGDVKLVGFLPAVGVAIGRAKFAEDL